MDLNNWPIDIDLENILPAIVIGVVQATKAEKTPQSTGQPGCEYLHELLQSSPKRIYDVLRMQRETFFELCNWLEINMHLEPLKHILVQEQVAMFL